MSKFIALLCLALCYGCICDKPAAIIQPVVEAGAHGVYITNEGNFLFGNSQVSYYNPETRALAQDLFEPANARPLGDICQSLAFFNGSVYIVVNNSGKIEQVRETDFQSIDIIHGLTSPRVILPVSNNKAYVTDLYANAISVVDLSENEITGTIPLPGWTEEMTLAYGKVFVTNQLGDHVIVMDTKIDAVIDSISVAFAANSIVEDKYGKLWVLCAGNPSAAEPGGLFQIDPLSHAVEKSFAFEVTETPWRLDIDGRKEHLFFLNQGVYRIHVQDAVLPAEPWIAQNGTLFYGLGIDPFTNEVYVSDPLDFVQRGRVHRYTEDGMLIESFLAGIIPGEFYFR